MGITYKTELHCHSKDASGCSHESVEGICEGSILTELHGESGFGYDPLFWVPSLGRTFAELDGQEKNSVSHRGRAVRALAMALKNRFEV